MNNLFKDNNLSNYQDINFSVIVPLFNKAPYIERSLNSVLRQSCGSFEIIVVDDCSTDNGLSIAQKVLAKCQHPYKIVQRSKRGGSCAPPRATGLRYARGNFVAFLDADDEWEEGFLAEITHLIENFPDAEAYAVDRELHIDGRVEPGPYGQRSDIKNAHAIDLERYLVAREKFGNPFRVPGMVFLPESLDDIGGFVHAPRSSDIDLMFRFFLAGKIAAWSPFKGLIIHRVPDSTMSQTPTQFTRPWFYTITEAIHRNALPKTTIKAMRSDMFRQKEDDIAAAVRIKTLQRAHINNLPIVRYPLFLFTSGIFILAPFLQGNLAATALKIVAKLEELIWRTITFVRS